MAMPVHAEIPAGYYNDADGLNKAELLDALNAITSSGNFLSYGSGEHSTWEGFYYTDRNEDGTVIDMYSDIVRTQDSFDAVDGMHIEHSFPKSWWGGTEINAYRDLYHLYPADGDINTLKNNLPLGVVGTATTDNGVSKINVATAIQLGVTAKIEELPRMAAVGHRPPAPVAQARPRLRKGTPAHRGGLRDTGQPQSLHRLSRTCGIHLGKGHGQRIHPAGGQPSLPLQARPMDED